MLIEVRISPEGIVEQKEILEDDIGEAEFGGCMLGHFEAPLGLAIEGGCAHVRIPLRFQPKKPDASSSPGGAPAAPTPSGSNAVPEPPRAP